MARENEIACLSRIKEALEDHTNVEIVHPYSSLGQVKNIFAITKPNPNVNDFPDFVFPNGGIEHFQVTSSSENKKNGSSFMEEQSKTEKEIKEHFENEINKIDFSSNKAPEIHVLQATEKYGNFSYEAFLKSLQRNIIKHVESLQKSSYLGKTIIFLMEQRTARMCFERDEFHAVFYLMTQDKKALRILKEFGKNVNFFVYCVADSIEIINTSVIDKLIEESKEHDNIDGGILTEISFDFVA